MFNKLTADKTLVQVSLKRKTKDEARSAKDSIIVFKRSSIKKQSRITNYEGDIEKDNFIVNSYYQKIDQADRLYKLQ